MRNLFLSDLGLKIFSVVLAALVWVAIDSNVHREGRGLLSLYRRKATTRLRCPVAVLVDPANRQTFKVEPAEVTVKLSGDASLVGKLGPGDVMVFVRLVDASNAKGPLPVELKLPAGATAQEIDPPKVTVLPVNAN